MKETKDNNQKLYKIRIYKDFEFPSFSIDSNNKLEDLYTKSIEEVEENFHGGEEGYFELEVTHILPFELKKDLQRVNTERAMYDYNFFIREIAINDLETKYGKLDYEANPTIFDRRTRNNGEIDTHSSYGLKSEIENYYIERVKHYCTVLENKMI